MLNQARRRNVSGKGLGWASEPAYGMGHGAADVGVVYCQAPTGGMSISAATIAPRTA